MIYVYLKSGQAVELAQARSARFRGRNLVCLAQSGTEVARFPRDEVSNFSERDLRAVLADSEAEQRQSLVEHA
jgi:hypothetical protein